MKRTAAQARSVTATCRQIVALMASAKQFVPQDRGEAMLRKWLSRIDIATLGEDRMVTMMADATRLAADLLLSYPAASGATAFDRLARSRAGAPAAEAALITALGQARFRLLRVSGDANADAVTAYDVLSGNALQIVGAVLPSQVSGVVLFARVVMLGDDRACLPGPITPLDSAASRRRAWPQFGRRSGCHGRCALGGGGLRACGAARHAPGARTEPADWRRGR